MSYPRTVRDYQIRINSLFFTTTFTPLKVDGMNGPKTRNGIDMAMKLLCVDNRNDIFDPSGITRVHWHWTASGYVVTPRIVSHYNDVFDYEGNHYDGGAPAQQQSVYIPNKYGVSHSLGSNTGAIGMAFAGMAGAKQTSSTVNQGKYPLTWEGIDGMLERTMEYCDMYDIKVSPWTTLTHAEIQRNLGIRQRGKWDIQCLPDEPGILRTSAEVGDILRKRMVEKFL